VAADTLNRACEMGGDCKPIGFLDDNSRLVGKTILDLPVYGTLAQLCEFDHDAVVIGIGDNATRARLFKFMLSSNERIANTIHPSAIIAPDVDLGKGVTICAGVVINTATVIGNNVVLNTGCTIDHHNLIDSHTHIGPGANLGGGTRTGEGALVGLGAAIVPGCSIGEWAVVGAGSVVTKDVAANTTVVGSPARVIRTTQPSDEKE